MLKRWLLRPSETPPHWQKQQVMLLSNIKLIHASWIVAAFQQVTKETLSRGWEKACIKECIDNCSMISRFDAHCAFNILFLLLTLSVIMAVFFL
jgi:hypothetical protein